MEKEHIVVGSVQINSGFSGQHYFPYSVGILQAYAKRKFSDPGRLEFLLPVYRRIGVTEAADQLLQADIAAFSVYVWNVRLSLAIAHEVKRRNPKTLIVFGGPQVPRFDRPWELDAFFADNPFVDLAVHGAGEKPFVDVIEHGLSGAWQKIRSVSFNSRNALYDGSPVGEDLLLGTHIVQTPLAPSFTNEDFAEVPSPYVSGTFDALIRTNPEEKWIALWETDRNCPFSCTFCGWGLLEKKPVLWPMERVLKDVDWFAEHEIEFVFCANANFFLLPRDLDIASYVVKKKLERGYPKRLSVQDSKNRPDQVFEGRMIMQEAGLNTGVVISLQSVDPETLRIVRRSNIRLDAYQELQRRYRAAGIETMTDIILPLAGQTYVSFAEGISDIIAHGQHNRINLNLCCVVPDAEMSHRDYMSAYGIESVVARTVNIHGQIENEEIPETQDLVIATAAMPREDWVRAIVYMWNVQLLYFNKLLQIPIVLIHEYAHLSYRDIIEFFADSRFGSADDFPLFTRIQSFFAENARRIQGGGTEYVHSPEWLDIHWQAYEYLMIELSVNGSLDSFYLEANRAFDRLLRERDAMLQDGVLGEALFLNRRMLKQPFEESDIIVEFSYNIMDFYRGVIGGNEVPLEKGTFRYRIDRSTQRWNSWDDWCREVVWYGYKRGDFFYGAGIPLPAGELAGHY